MKRYENYCCDCGETWDTEFPEDYCPQMRQYGRMS